MACRGWRSRGGGSQLGFASGAQSPVAGAGLGVPGGAEATDGVGDGVEELCEAIGIADDVLFAVVQLPEGVVTGESGVLSGRPADNAAAGAAGRVGGGAVGLLDGERFSRSAGRVGVVAQPRQRFPALRRSQPHCANAQPRGTRVGRISLSHSGCPRVSPWVGAFGADEMGGEWLQPLHD